ncbi:hypothetical protein ACHAXS_001552 [Conticribra weissflogii]
MVNSRSTTIASCSFFLSLYLVITTIRTSLYSQFDLDHAPSPFQWHLTSLAVGSTPKTPPQCIIFLHIPKVGGRTVNTFLKGVVASTGMKMQTLYPKDLRELTLRQSDRLQAGERKYSPRDADRSSPRVPSRISRDRPLIHGKDDFTDNGTKTDSVPRGAREKSHRPLRQHRRSSVDENEILDNLSFNNTVTTGHFTTILFDKSLHSESCFKMTVLREPVSRAISAFFYHKHNYPRDVDSCLSTGDVDTSRKGTRPCRLQWQYSNDMTRRLAGLPDTKWLTFLEDQYLASTPNQSEYLGQIIIHSIFRLSSSSRCDVLHTFFIDAIIVITLSYS